MIGAGPFAITPRVTGLALLLAPPARGAERMPVLPEELAITRSIDVQDEDEFQTSLSARHLRLPHERSTTMRAEVEYGVTDRVQARLEVPYAIRDPAEAHGVNGLQDLLGFRYALLDFRTRPLALDVGLTLGLPTGSRRKALGAGDVSLEPNFTLSRWLGRMNGQLSFSWRRSGIGGRAEAEDELEYDVALLYPWREWFLTFPPPSPGTAPRRPAAPPGVAAGLGPWDVSAPASRPCPGRRAVWGHPLTADPAATRLDA